MATTSPCLRFKNSLIFRSCLYYTVITPVFHYLQLPYNFKKLLSSFLTFFPFLFIIETSTAHPGSFVPEVIFRTMRTS